MLVPLKMTTQQTITDNKKMEITGNNNHNNISVIQTLIMLSLCALLWHKQ
jgi:hypothetical protein